MSVGLIQDNNYSLIQKITFSLIQQNQSPVTTTMPHNHRHIGYRNSTIKQEEQQINVNGLQNDSSISMHEQQIGAYYYDLDYSDENINEGIVSSSDQNEREITHDQFMRMIATNQQRNKTEDDASEYQYVEQNNAYDKNCQQQQFINYSRNIHSNQPNRYQHFKRHTPSTKDKSYQFHSYQINYLHKKERNDPQKSVSFIKNHPKPSSFNNIQQNSVRQFRIDSFLHPQSYHDHKDQQKRQQLLRNNGRSKRQNTNKSQIYYQHEQDESFSLITLPQYDDESYSSSLSKPIQKQNIPINRQQQNININRKNIKQKYRNVAKLRTEEEHNYYQKLNWRYQQAKIKFMDNFLPQPLKIGTNSYNMLKYINKKHQMTYNMLKMM